MTLEKIKTDLTSIWEQEVKKSFQNGMICSERHLQSLFYKFLAIDPMIAWVEPKIAGVQIKSIEGYTPDILFTLDNEIMTVIELKYTPYYVLEPQNDLYRLRTFHQEKTEQDDYALYLKINPANGDWNTKEVYKISPKMLFVYGVIAREGSPSLQEDVFKDYETETYLHLKIGV